MARFDVFRVRAGDGYLLDCQADFLNYLGTRFVVPLLPSADAPRPIGRLNPVFEIEGENHVMLTQSAAAISVKEVGDLVGSLSDRDTDIGNALDMLLVGF